MARAAKAEASLTIPDWPQSPDGVRQLARDAVASAEADLKVLVSQPNAQLTLQSTAGAFDHLRWKIQTAANVATLLTETTSDAPMRDAAAAALKSLHDWDAAVAHRADVYLKLRRLKEKRTAMTDEDQRLLETLLRDFHRAGVDLYPESADAVANLRGELAPLGSRFDANITQAAAPLTLKRAELEGMPEGFLEKTRSKTTDDEFTVMANVMWQFNAIEANARREETRRKVEVAHDNLAAEKNVPVLNRMLALRNELARRLGYKSWADYQTETQMAKNAATAQQFVDDLAAKLQPTFAVELAELRKLKARDTGDPQATISLWDWRYYSARSEQERFSVDRNELRNFFPFERVRNGMLAIYSRIFGLEFDEVAPPQKWTDPMQLYVASDSGTGAPLGLIYLDLFTHEGKTNVGGTSDIISGKLLPDGRRQCPAVAILLNFAPPAGETPALLAHDEVEMLFHEFGHALHAILTRAKYAQFAGTNVPRDFVEAPSQMLQNWIWDKRVLDTFAADYRDPSKKIPAAVVEKMRKAKVAAAGLFYRRQCAFAQTDLALHAPHDRGRPYDCVTTANRVFENTFLPPAPHTAFIASFRGMNGYDAAYYGYAWSDVLASDMASVFENAPNGYLDRAAGMRLRREIFEPGGSRDVNVSVEKFLGRKPSPRAFLNKIGVKGR